MKKKIVFILAIMGMKIRKKEMESFHVQTSVRAIESEYKDVVRTFNNLRNIKDKTKLLSKLDCLVELCDFALYSIFIFNVLTEKYDFRNYKELVKTYQGVIETAKNRARTTREKLWTEKRTKYFGVRANSTTQKVPPEFSGTRELVVVSSNGKAAIKEHKGDFICDHIHSVDDLNSYYKNPKSVNGKACPMCNE